MINLTFGLFAQVSNSDAPYFQQVAIIFFLLLYGLSMFAVKATIYGVLYHQASSIAFDETSSYWTALKSS